MYKFILLITTFAFQYVLSDPFALKPFIEQDLDSDFPISCSDDSQCGQGLACLIMEYKLKNRVNSGRDTYDGYESDTYYW